MKTLFTAAAILAAGSAQALPPAPAPAAAATTTVATTAAVATPDTKRLCVLEETTGSRLPIKTCKTAAEWDALGVKYRVKR